MTARGSTLDDDFSIKRQEQAKLEEPVKKISRKIKRKLRLE
jgi:hypothetical protein